MFTLIWFLLLFKSTVQPSGQLHILLGIDLFICITVACLLSAVM